MWKNTEIDNMKDKASLGKFQGIDVMEIMSFDHNGSKIEIGNGKIRGFCNTFKQSIAQKINHNENYIFWTKL